MASARKSSKKMRVDREYLHRWFGAASLLAFFGEMVGFGLLLEIALFFFLGLAPCFLLELAPCFLELAPPCFPLFPVLFSHEMALHGIKSTTTSV